jgi:hypothetical protein
MGKYSAWRGGKVQQHDCVNCSTSANHEDDLIVVPDVIPALVDRNLFAKAAAAMSEAQKRTCPAGDANRYLFTHAIVCGDCGSFLRGQPFKGKKIYICAKYKEYGSKACQRNTIGETPLLKAILAKLLDDVLNPERLDAIEAEMARRLESDRASGETDRLRQQIAALDRDLKQGNANLARLPEDRLPGVVTQLREWEGERAGLLARLEELESGTSNVQDVLDAARRQLWRLREALEGDDEEAQAVVIREVVSKIEVRFTHEKTDGKRSPTGKGHLYNKVSEVILYVRAGLGMSCLSTLDCQNRVLVCGGEHANNCPLAGVIPD